MSDNERVEAVVGALGMVTIAIGGGRRPGEVQIPMGGFSESFIAYADEPIERGSQVLVVGRRPSRILDVTPFDN